MSDIYIYMYIYIYIYIYILSIKLLQYDLQLYPDLHLCVCRYVCLRNTSQYAMTKTSSS